MSTRGYIPEAVEYYCQKPKKIKMTWDSAWNVKDRNVIWEGDVIPTFPIPGDATDRRRLSAKKWAENPNGKWVDGKWIEIPTSKPDEYKFDNQPFSIVICSLEHRGNGGRAYKVMTEDGFYFDLREDVLLEALLTEGCEPGGFLGGKFLWMMAHNSMKLIREGSQIHEDMKDATKRRAATVIPNNQLVVGCVYGGKDTKDQALFLGEVIVGKGRPKLLFFPLDRYGYRNKQTPQQEFDGYQQAQYANGGIDFYRYDFKFTHKYVEKVDEVSLPKNHLAGIRSAALAEMRKRIDENYAMRGHNPNKKECLKFFRPLVHMHQLGEEMPIIEEFIPRRKSKAKK